MNDFEDRLTTSVAASASFDASAVAERVAVRRRRRRAAGIGAAAVVALLVVGVAVAWMGGDDGADVEAIGDPPTSIPDDPGEPQGLEPVDEVADGPVTDGPVSDVHVEATDLVFPECTNPIGLPDVSPARQAELQAIYEELVADGLHDPVLFLTSSSAQGGDGRIQIGLERRYGPTIDWLAERVAVYDLCFWLLPPVGAFTEPPDLLDWELLPGAEPGPENTTFTIRLDAECGIIVKERLLPAQVTEFEDRVEVAVPIRPRFGPTGLPCFPPDEFVVELSEPLGDREIVAAPTPTSVRLDLPGEAVPAGMPFVVTFDPAGLGEETTMGDDVMVQRVDDPSVQIQVTGVFTATPTAGPPAPIATDRWEPLGTARLVVPEDTPPGDYTIVFIEHPQFNGTVTIT